MVDATSNLSPTVSFLVLSYNNAQFVRAALDSILSQTFADFEVVFLDDASTDDSVNIAKSYDDRRIRIYQHDKNRGLTPSYNEAVSLCRGDFISNLDSDDAITPSKTEKQLNVFRNMPNVEVVGTYIEVIDETGARHKDAHIIEGIINVPQDFNAISNWIGKNNLPRSSTMMAKSLHQRVGPNQLGMVRAPDYDLWVRALASGTRFYSIHEPLTLYRQHSKGLTYGDPTATYLELAYSFIKHLVPLMELRSDYQSFADAFSWMVESPQFSELTAAGRETLASMPFLNADLKSYQDFLVKLDEQPTPQIKSLGKKLIAQHLLHPSISKSNGLIGGIEWSKQQILNWREAYDNAIAMINELEAQRGHGLESSERKTWASMLQGLVKLWKN